MCTFSEIMEKLKAAPDYPNFIRHINGNTLDNRLENLCWVKLSEAFQNITNWKVDWVCYLTEEEVRFVKDLLDSRS